MVGIALQNSPTPESSDPQSCVGLLSFPHRQGQVEIPGGSCRLWAQRIQPQVTGTLPRAGSVGLLGKVSKMKPWRVRQHLGV